MIGMEHINSIFSSSEIFCFLLSNILKINISNMAKRFILQLKSVCVCLSQLRYSEVTGHHFLLKISLQRQAFFSSPNFLNSLLLLLILCTFYA